MSFYLKIIKIVHKQIQGFGVFSCWLDGFEITCTSIQKKCTQTPYKNCTQNPYFFQKFDFCIFESKIMK